MGFQLAIRRWSKGLPRICREFHERDARIHVFALTVLMDVSSEELAHMIARLLPLVVFASTILFSPRLHALDGSITPVTLSLTFIRVVGTLPDADKNGQPDAGRESHTATKDTYEFKTKFVAQKITNAVFLNEVKNEGLIDDLNYSLVMALDNNARPIGFYLIRKGEATIVTPPIDVTQYLSFVPVEGDFLVAMAMKTTVQASNGSVKYTYSESFSAKGPVEMRVLPFPAQGMFDGAFSLDSAKECYLMSSAKITAVTGGDEYGPIEGSIAFAASKAVDITPFTVE